MGKLIDADKLKRKCQKVATEAWKMKIKASAEVIMNQFIDFIDKAEPVDAVHVRCKDCRYNSNPPECGNAACVLFYGMTDQMGFCHHGERREQDETD